jgi:RNA polymerase sigma-70 factor (sigma-E family)
VAQRGDLVEETVDAQGDVTASSALDRLGYEEFVALRGPALVRLARGLLKDPHLAEDVVQDVLARALLQWSRVSAAHDVDAYVRRMVVNACTSWFRRAARRERATDQALVLDRPVGDRTDQFVERDQLVTLLRKLPAKQRAVLVLRHYEGLPDAEIARMLGTSEVTVRSNAHRALARLRELIAESDALARTGEIKLASGRRPRRPKPPPSQPLP